jgi:hypothetical protein
MHSPTIEIVACPVDQHGRFVAKLGGQPLCRGSRQPYLDAARRLVELGHDPDALLIMFRDGVPSLFGRLGAAAKLTIAEGDRGVPRFRLWKAVPLREGSPPIAPGRPAATSHPGAARASVRPRPVHPEGGSR